MFGNSIAYISGSTGFTGLPLTIWTMKLPGAGSTDQMGVPTGRVNPEKTFTVIVALNPLKLAVSVAVPDDCAVICGGARFAMLGTRVSLMLPVFPVTSWAVLP